MAKKDFNSSNLTDTAKDIMATDEFKAGCIMGIGMVSCYYAISSACDINRLRRRSDKNDAKIKYLKEQIKDLESRLEKVEGEKEES